MSDKRLAEQKTAEEKAVERAKQKAAEEKDIDAWSGAIMEFYEGVRGDVGRLTSLSTTCRGLVFPVPSFPFQEDLATREDEIREGKILWTSTREILNAAADGYRLGYAIQLLLQRSDGLEEATWEKVKAAVSGDKDLGTFLLFLDWVLNKPGMEDSDDAKALCGEAYKLFFGGKLDSFERFFEDAYDELSDHEKIIDMKLEHGTPFCMGMEQAAKDLKTGLESAGGWQTTKDGRILFLKSEVPRIKPLGTHSMGTPDPSPAIGTGHEVDYVGDKDPYTMAREALTKPSAEQNFDVFDLLKRMHNDEFARGTRAPWAEAISALQKSPMPTTVASKWPVFVIFPWKDSTLIWRAEFSVMSRWLFDSGMQCRPCPLWLEALKRARR
ncbi:hypothetical protein QBC45DRAFT_443435 [Copromyces sp. CBS 386.78]|nr:hypothetical protein QBC45DRAFT_443435 [Copromyces sp. CBS 386.78]